MFVYSEENVKQLRDEVPHLTAKADALNKEAEILDKKIACSSDEFKICKWQTQASNKRLQAIKVMTKVDDYLVKIKLYNKLHKTEL